MSAIKIDVDNCKTEENDSEDEDKDKNKPEDEVDSTFMLFFIPSFFDWISWRTVMYNVGKNIFTA